MTSLPIPRQPVEVWFVLPTGSLILDWAGPAEAFRMASNETASLLPGGAFRMRFCAPQPESRSSVGALLAGLEPLPAQVAAPAWIVLVGKTGPDLRRGHANEDRRVIDWLTRLRPGSGNGLRLVTVCSGALLAAQAGLLNGRRVTTHHLDLEHLKELSESATVVPDRVFVEDGELCSSAGVTAGIDLALHLVAQHCGAVVAARVAQRMAVALRRGPDDPQLSPFLAHRQHFNARLHRVQDAVSRAPREPWSAERMAELANTTPRTLNRLFSLHACTTPLAYLRSIRLALARQALEAGSTVGRAAEAAGFSSDLQLRRAWQALGEEGAPSGRRRRTAAARAQH
jgi:transcriptional regulator GlxA family with amidase domain